MRVVGEKISFVSDPDKGELVLFMGGFRMELSGEEAQLLGEVIARGLKELHPDAREQHAPEVAMLLRSDVGWRDKVTLGAGEREDGLADQRPVASARTRLGR